MLLYLLRIFKYDHQKILKVTTRLINSVLTNKKNSLVIVIQFSLKKNEAFLKMTACYTFILLIFISYMFGLSFMSKKCPLFNSTKLK